MFGKITRFCNKLNVFRSPDSFYSHNNQISLENNSHQYKFKLLLKGKWKYQFFLISFITIHRKQLIISKEIQIIMQTKNYININFHFTRRRTNYKSGCVICQITSKSFCTRLRRISMEPSTILIDNYAQLQLLYEINFFVQFTINYRVSIIFIMMRI